MHRAIKDHLEDYLSGRADTVSLREIEDHLAACNDCRAEVDLLREHGHLLRRLFRPPGEFEPAPGFYARVMDRIESQARASVWSAFLEPAFTRRLVYASLTLLLLLGGLMMSSENQPALSSPNSPEVILAEEPTPSDFGVSQQHDRDVVLVNLATYQE
jgi:anti-sigma factor RsiW